MPGEDDLDGGQSAKQQPAQNPDGRPPTPPEAAADITVISVPAVVTEREAKYVGEARDDIRPMEETVPLGTQSEAFESGQRERAAALLDWEPGDALPEPLRFAEEEVNPTRVPLAALFPNATAPWVGYDSGRDRARVVALTDTGGRAGPPILLAMGQAPAARAGPWYVIALEMRATAAVPPVTLELVAHDHDAWYIRTAAPSAESNSRMERSVWVVPKTVYSGEQAVVSLFRSENGIR